MLPGLTLLVTVLASHGGVALRGTDQGLLIGPNFGWTARDFEHAGAFALGLEASWARFDWSSLSWAGVYADAVYDFGQGHTRLSFGPELGVLFLGIDGGPLIVAGEAGGEVGLRGRVMVSFVGASLYFGGGATRGEDTGFFDAGLLLKLPIELD